MRSLAAALSLIALLAGPAQAQISLLGARNSLIQFALSRLSTPEGFGIAAESIEDTDDGATELRGVAISDAEGVWLRAEALGLNWSARRILLGQLQINRLEARGVQVLRRPVATPTPVAQEAPAEEEAEPFAWPRAPITTRIDALALNGVSIAPGVIAEQGLAFDAAGSARDEGDEQSAELTLTRTDAVQGYVDLSYVRDFDAGTLRLDLTADEGPGGVAAALAGFPPDTPTQLGVVAEGPLAELVARFDAAAQDVFQTDGVATVKVTAPAAVDAQAAFRPGPAAPQAVRSAFGEVATLTVRAAEGADGVIRIDAGRLEAAALRLSADGSFARDGSASDLAVALEADAPLADLAEGVDFERVTLDAQVSGPFEDLTATGAARLAGLRTGPADVADAALDVSVRVTDGPRVAATLTGAASGLRLDRLQPETVGAADLDAELVYEGERLTLTRLTLDSPLLTAETAGAVDLAAATLDVDYAVDAPDLAPIAAAYDAEAAGALSVAGRAEGGFDAPRLVGEATLTDLRAAGEDLGRVALTHDATLGDTLRLDADLRAEGSRFGPATAALDATLAGPALSLETLRAEALGLRAEGAGAVNLDTLLTDATLDLEVVDLAPASRLLGGPVAGTGALSAALTARDGAQDVALTGALRDVAAPDVRLALLSLDVTGRDVLGAGASGSGDVTVAALDAFGAQAAALRLTGRLDDLRGTGAADVSLEADGLAYAPAEATLDTLRLTGAATDLLGDVSGAADLTAAGLAAYGAEVAAIDLTGEAERLRAGGPATLSLAASRLAYAPADAALASLTLDASGTALLDDPSAQARLVASDLSAAGATLARLTLDAEAADAVSRPSGTLALRGERLAAGGATVPTLSADAALTQGDGPARATLTAAIPSVAAAGARIGAVALDAAATDPLGADPAITADLSVAAVDAAPLTLGRSTLRAEGALSALDLRLRSAGSLARTGADDAAVSLAADASVNAADAPATARVTRLDAGLGEARARLNRPLALSVGETTTARDLDLALPGGRLTGQATAHPEGVEAALDLSVQDLGPLMALAGAPVTGGGLELDARVDTRLATAGARADLTARGLEIEGVDPDVTRPDIDAALRWNGRRAALDASIEGQFGQPIEIEAATPLRAVAGGAPQTAPGTPIEARLRWDGRIGALWAAVPAPDHVLDGDVVMDLQIAGPLAKPDIDGVLTLRDGAYQNLETGTILTDITLDTTAGADGSLGVALRAADGASGRVALDAAIAAGDLDATLTTAQAVLVRREDATVSLTADIAAAGPLAGPSITGDVLIDRAEIRLVSSGAPTLPDLGEVRIKGEPEPPDPGPPPQIAPLDLTITAPDGIFVRGRGLDSEWKADLQVGGFATAPEIVGAIERIRGQLSLVGRILRLERGEIRFFGGQPVDPTLDIALLRDSGGVRGGIVVRGRASDPEIAFESTPSLPEGEVLPRVLFDKSEQALSGSEALSLAIGVATLLDGGGGPLDGFRSAVGLDVLRLDTDGEETGLTVGTTVADGVFVGARQPVGGGPATATVEIELFDNVTVDSEVSPERGSSVGLNWRRDF